ncbi:MAG: methyltransferase domain-containing protein [Thermoplasmata archaeon]|nr:MAG: methyltransferase domain-containing protein [Thermoplasmata archaeon]
MDKSDYFFELYTGLPRGGPGDNESTRRAYNCMENLPSEPLILDIGCGPGMQTLELARISGGKIIALDNHQGFLDKLKKDANNEKLDDQIEIRNQSMLEMDFEDGTFDIIWSEGALYFMGFQNGLKKCRQLLKDKGYLAITQAVYLQKEVPEEVIQYWDSEYDDIDQIENTMELIKKVGFDLISHFKLPVSSWMDNYYDPMSKRIIELEEKYKDNETALKVLNASRDEIEFFKKYSDYYGYEFFIMRK